MQIKGIVISEETGYIDYDKLKRKNINYVILRAGFTTYGLSKNKNIDKKFEYNYRKALKNNMNISCYYESCAVSVDEAKEEAEFLCKLIENKKISNPIFMLIRDDHNTVIYSNKSQKTINKNELCNIVNKFCQTIKSYEYEVGLISYKIWFDNIINDNRLLKYNNIILPDNFDKINNINYDLYTDNTIYICRSTVHDISKDDKIKIVLKEDCIKDKIKSLFRVSIKFLKNKFSFITSKK